MISITTSISQASELCWSSFDAAIVCRGHVLSNFLPRPTFFIVTGGNGNGNVCSTAADDHNCAPIVALSGLLLYPLDSIVLQ